MIIQVGNESKEKPQALWYDSSTNTSFIPFLRVFLVHLHNSACSRKPGTLHSLVQTFLNFLWSCGQVSTKAMSSFLKAVETCPQLHPSKSSVETVRLEEKMLN